jgi:branched-chain amino acid transport system ATP-binding protein
VTPLVELDALTAGYGAAAAVRNLSLSVDAGEVVALLGPNGAGKTTTLLTISGFLRPLAGEVRVLGEPTSRLSPSALARRGVAHVPEDRALFYALTARENLRLGARNHKSALGTVLEYFPELERVLDSRAGLLSGGEQQMLAVGRALAAQPRVLVVDEMSLGLAPIVVQRLLPLLRDIAAGTGAAVLFVEQHVHLALTVADRAYVLSHGDLVLEGPARDLAARAELVQASYLGEAVEAATRTRASTNGSGAGRGGGENRRAPR